MRAVGKRMVRKTKKGFKSRAAKGKGPLFPSFTLAGIPERRGFRRLFLATAIVYCLSFSSVSVGDTDDQLMLTSAFSFVETGKFLAPSRFATKEFHGTFFGSATASGEVYSKYPPGYSLVLMAFLPLAGAAGRLMGSVAADIVLCFPSIIALLATMVLIWRTALRLGYGEETARLLSLAFALGSFAWGYAGTNYNEPYQALCAVAAFYGLLAARQEPNYWRRYALVGGFALGYGILLRPYFAILAPPMVLGALLGWRKDSSLRDAIHKTAIFAAPAVLASSYIILTNLILFGSTTDFGYGREAFDTPLREGLFGLLIGPRKGLIWFFPLAALVPWSAWKLARTGKKWAVGVLAATASAQFLLIGKWWGYESGRAWGDRLILGVLPLVVLLAGGIADSTPWRKAARILVAAGIFLNLPGVLINRLAYQNIAGSSQAPRRATAFLGGQIPGHFWLLGVGLSTPVYGAMEATPLWKNPPWSLISPGHIPLPYRNAAEPIWNAWPIRVFLPADSWTRGENGYMRGLLEVAILRYEQQNWVRALTLLDRGLRLNPASARFLAAKGMVLLTLGERNQALGFFDRAIQADPSYDLGLYGRALTLESLGDYTAAKEAYRRVLEAPQGTLDRKEIQAHMETLGK
jgi:hypothetical protein